MKNLYSINDCYHIWKKENQNILNPLTFRRYNNLLEKHLLPYFTDVLARDITERDIDDFVNKKQKENMSEVTLNMLIMLLKRLLQTAEIDTIKLGLEHTVRIHISTKNIEVMRKEEQHLLNLFLSSSSEPKYLGICLAFKMGMAIGEICALEWTDIDFEKGVMQIRNTVQRLQNTKRDGSKTLLVKIPLPFSTQRELPIPKSVWSILQKYKTSEQYVLKCKKDKIPDPRTEQIRLEKLCEKQQMRRYNFHTLRDTFAVRCLEAGMSIENLSYVLGHSSAAITAKRYKIFLEEKQEQEVILRRIMELV